MVLVIGVAGAIGSRGFADAEAKGIERYCPRLLAPDLTALRRWSGALSSSARRLGGYDLADC